MSSRYSKKLVKSFFLTLILLGGMGILPYQRADALSGADFIPGRIVEDNILYNGSSMDSSDVQNFLNAKIPSCDTNGTQVSTHYNSAASRYYTRAEWGASKGYSAPYTCLRNYTESTPSKASDAYCLNPYTGGVKTAAQIIADIGLACGISQKSILVLLQKEQTLVTDDWPWSIQYRSATGYGCPDTAACDAQYYGFFNQVYNASRQFKRYAIQSQLFNYRAGLTSYIQFNPNSDCGGTYITVQNAATAALYNYTPYQPNAAALGNLYGTGDGCSAYGNRNFWRIYTDWFGPTNRPASPTNNPISSWEIGVIDAFTRGSDGGLWQRNYTSYLGGWSPWKKVLPTIDSDPTTIHWDNGRLHTFITNNSGEITHTWSSYGNWQPLERFNNPSGITFVGAPGAVSWGTGRIDVFARGSDGGLWQKWYDASFGGWQPWSKLTSSGTVNSSPTVSSWGKGRLDVSFTGTSGELRHVWYGGNWSGNESLGTPPTATLNTAPGTVSWGTGRIDVFARGSDGGLWQKWYDASFGGWQPWSKLTSSGTVNSSPTVSSWGKGRLDITTKDLSGNQQHLWFDKGWGSSWESLGVAQ